MTISYTTQFTNPRYFQTKDYTSIKMERTSSDDDRSSPLCPGIPITTVMTANENWRGKNDPAERRRIQNRLNQRAFRERQRAGESPKQYKPRSGSSTKSDSRSRDEEAEEDDDDEEESEEEEEAESPQSEESRPSPNADGQSIPVLLVTDSQTTVTTDRQTSAETDNQLQLTGRVCDELARIINRNLMSAAVTNAQHLSIDLNALRSNTHMKTPRTSNRQIPQTLIPVELQYQVAHDPIIDTIPHARLRFNILRAIATAQIDATEFSKSVRASGALENHNGNWLRGGLVVWSASDQAVNWELSEPFVRRWYLLLQGCEDLLQATNVWRGRRGERLFPLTFGSGQGCA